MLSGTYKLTVLSTTVNKTRKNVYLITDTKAAVFEI